MCPSFSPDSETLINGFKALSDPLRLQVIELLRGQELCVCDLCDRLEVAQSKLSFHLKILKTANLIIARQQGKWVYYQLNADQLAQLEQFLSDLAQISPQPARVCAEAPGVHRTAMPGTAVPSIDIPQKS